MIRAAGAQLLFLPKYSPGLDRAGAPRPGVRHERAAQGPPRPHRAAGVARTRQTATHRALINIAEEVVAGVRKALEDTAAMRGSVPLTVLKIEAVRDEITSYCDLGRVIEQARRRVLDGEQVPASGKICSIFEPHTDFIKRGKVRMPVEFGHKVLFAESARGLITQYEVLKGNLVDEIHVAPSLRASQFAYVPAHKTRYVASCRDNRNATSHR
jgi:hypothetical protein